jgi:hypothetical protein
MCKKLFLFILYYFSSLAREAIRVLLQDKQIAPHNDDYHSNKCNFVKTANFVAPVAEKKEEKKAQSKK